MLQLAPGIFTSEEGLFFALSFLPALKAVVPFSGAPFFALYFRMGIRLSSSRQPIFDMSWRTLVSWVLYVWDAKKKEKEKGHTVWEPRMQRYTRCRR